MNELALFAGVGGGILASRALGHNVVCAVEIDPFCREILLWRQRDGVLGMFPVWDDVRTFDGDPWRGKVDLVSAGFPCPPFSVAGKQRAGADERNMWPATLEVIRRVRPSYVFLENVPGLLAGSHGYFGTVLAGLADAGFDAEWACLSAAEVGAPHKRDRVWVWAYLPDAERVVLRDEPGRSSGAGGADTGVAGDDGATR